MIMENFIKADLRLTRSYLPSNLIQSGSEDDLVYLYSLNIDKQSIGINRHLYALGNRQVLEGEWTIGKNGFPIIYGHDFSASYSKDEIEVLRPIIVTSDNNLKTRVLSSLGKAIIEVSIPIFGQNFIKEYVECYNKNTMITDILVETYEYDPGIDSSGYGFPTGNPITLIKKDFSSGEAFVKADKVTINN